MNEENTKALVEAVDKLSDAMVTIGVVMREVVESVETVIDNLPEGLREAIEDDG